MATADLGAVLPTLSTYWHELGQAAHAAEEAGLRYIFCNEQPGSDAMTGAQALIAGTSRAHIGTSVANIYLRHPYLMARSAAMLQALSKGRFILGLGTSHDAINRPKGLGSPHPIRDMDAYVGAVRSQLAREESTPIWLGALRQQMTQLAGGLADGVIFHLVPVGLLRKSVAVLRAAEANANRSGRVHVAAYARIAIASDLAHARARARKMLAFYLRFPAYQALFSAQGFAGDVEAWTRAGTASGPIAPEEAISDSLIDATCIVGSEGRCVERIQEYQAAGVEILLLAPVPEERASLSRLFTPAFRLARRLQQ